MPYTWDGKPIESKADARTDVIGAKEIGGIGELIYHLFRFSEYDWDVGNDNLTYIYPMCDKNHPPQLVGKRDKATGKDILASLCNLAKKIYGLNEKKLALELIINWCKTVAHPYDIDLIYNELSDEGFDASTDGRLVEKDGRFSYERFMHDLERLYRTALFYIALENLCLSIEDDAYNLYCEGRHLEGLPFFEQYKVALPDIPEGLLPKHKEESRNALLEDMQKVARYMKKHPVEQPPDGEFAQTPYDDYYELRDTLIDLMPDFTIRLKMDTKTKGLVFAADVKSVFDIAWYSFARMMASDPPLEKIGKEKPKHQEGIMVCCRCCGDFIIRRNSRQEYCDKKECQKARNSKNQFLFRERKRVEKGQERGRRRGNG